MAHGSNLTGTEAAEANAIWRASDKQEIAKRIRQIRDGGLGQRIEPLLALYDEHLLYLTRTGGLRNESTQAIRNAILKANDDLTDYVLKQADALAAVRSAAGVIGTRCAA